MPKRVGKYELGRTLGRGHFSKVKIGVHLDTGKSYAVKVIDRRMCFCGEEQLRRDVDAMKSLDHPNVVQLIEFFETEGNIYLILEMVAGCELFDLLREVVCSVPSGHFSEGVARPFFKMLLEAVKYCHGMRVFHKDLKPETLLLVESKVQSKQNTCIQLGEKYYFLKVSDFGMSNIRGLEMQAPDRSKQLDRVWAYVAPDVYMEQTKRDIPPPLNQRPRSNAMYAEPEARVLLRGVLTSQRSIQSGFAADMWSCGVMLFVMLSGFLPFDGNTEEELQLKSKLGELSMPKGISSSAMDLIGRLLLTEPTLRLNVSQALAHPWLVNE